MHLPEAKLENLYAIVKQLRKRGECLVSGNIFYTLIMYSERVLNDGIVINAVPQLKVAHLPTFYPLLPGSKLLKALHSSFSFINKDSNIPHGI
jgi:hypothetical protein